jgi:hypothetical protein
MKNYTQFSMLLESLLTEDSTGIEIFRKYPDGLKLIKAVHTHPKFKLPHDSSWTKLRPSEVTKASVEGRLGDRILVAVTDNGLAAVKADETSHVPEFTVILSPEMTVRKVHTVTDMRRLLNNSLGKVSEWWISNTSTNMSTKLNQRKNYKSQSTSGDVVIDDNYLFNRFRPLFLKIMTQAQNDLQGFIITLLKNGAYKRAISKTQQLELLTNWKTALEVEKDQGRTANISPYDNKMKDAIVMGLALTAAHYYPDETGDLIHGVIGPHNRKGMNLILQDISRGDTRKLSTVLAFFKQSMIS